MKFNWGHGILIAIVLSVGGILMMAYLSARVRIDLVEDEYYPQGLIFEQQIEKRKNANNLKQKAEISHLNDVIKICFPSAKDKREEIKGEAWLYFAAKKAFDIQEKIKIDSSACHSLVLKNLPSGKYKLILDWSDGEKSYLQEKLLILNF